MIEKNTQTNIQQLFFRVALAIALLSAVADRFGFWKTNAAWGNWQNFETYTRQLTFFLPVILSKISAYLATTLETVFGILLLVGFRIKIIANLTGLLLLIFALSMSVSLGIKSAFDYSVWVGSAGAFLLASQPEFAWSLDRAIINKKRKNQ